MIAEINMHVQLKFGLNWTTNMGDMANQILLVVIFFLQFDDI